MGVSGPRAQVGEDLRLVGYQVGRGECLLLGSLKGLPEVVTPCSNLSLEWRKVRNLSTAGN